MDHSKMDKIGVDDQRGDAAAQRTGRAAAPEAVTGDVSLPPATETQPTDTGRLPIQHGKEPISFNGMYHAEKMWDRLVSSAFCTLHHLLNNFPMLCSRLECSRGVRDVSAWAAAPRAAAR